MLWSDASITAVAAEAESFVASELNCITKRISLQIRRGTSIYNIPDDVIAIRRVTWKGKKLEPLAFRSILQYPIVNPAGTIGAFDAVAFDNAAFNTGGSNSTPQSGTPTNYFYSGFGENVIKIFPTPAVNVSAFSSDLFGTNIANAVIVEYYCFPDLDGHVYRLPHFIARRIIKAFSLSRLLLMEGAGQDIVGSARHQVRFTQLLNDFKRINTGVFVSRQLTRSPGANNFATRISRPQLPTNFGIRVDD